MKRIILLLLVVGLLLSSCACGAVLEDGVYYPTYGLAHPDRQEDHVDYQFSYWNAFLGIIFVETVIVPIVVVANKLYVPVGLKALSSD